MNTSTIQLPPDLGLAVVGQAGAFLSNLFGGTTGLLTIIIGILLATAVVEILIGIFRK